MEHATPGSREDLPQEAILSIDNIALDLPIAGVGSRALAAGIDYFLLGFFGIVVFLVVLASPLSDLGTGWGLAVAIVLGFCLYWGYFLMQELAFGGRTLGKMAVHLRVVGRSGGAPAAVQLVLRNLLRPVDMVVGVPLMAIDPLARRLGDRAGGTLVVHDRPPEKREVALGRIPAGWDSRQVRVAESLLQRADGMDPDQARHLALRLVRLILRDEPDLFEGGPHPADDPVAALRHALGVAGEEG